MRGYPGYRGRGPFGPGFGPGYGWRGPRPFMFFPFGLLILPVLAIAFVGLFMLKFLWPLLLIGLGIALFKGWGRGHGGFGPRHGFGHGRGGWEERWNEKYKNDWDSEEKPKRDSDEPRFTRTADGEWVEIV